MLKPENYYLLRIPNSPISDSESILNISDKVDLYSIIKSYCESESFKESIFLASPILYSEMIKLLKGDLDEEKSEKVYKSLFKYIVRNSCRCTPFGLFAGTSLGKIGEYTSVILKTNENHGQYLRLDMQLINAIIEKLIIIPEVNKVLKYYPNSSCYYVADKLNYFEAEKNKNVNNYNLVSVDLTLELNNILEFSKNGLTKLQLFKCLEGDEYSREEIEWYINELINNQILIHNLNFSITGNGAFSELKNKLENLSKEIQNGPVLETIIEKFNSIEQILLSNQILSQKQRLVENELRTILEGFDYSNDFFQIDLSIDSKENQISERILSEISQDILEVMSSMNVQKIAEMENFKSSFIRRYENQEMPLAEVLDNEFGIGYGNSNNHLIGNSLLINEVSEGAVTLEERKEYTKYDNFLQHKLMSSLRENIDHINISSEDLIELKSHNTEFPNSMYILGSIISGNSQDLDEGKYNFLFNICHGPSSSTLMTRFCHTDIELTNNIKYSTKKEDIYNSTIYAEIVHIPHSNIGNISYRPIIRDYEIPFLSPSSLSNENKIAINDIYVSIKNGLVILRSAKLNKRIVPRLTTAHNFNSASLPIYKFLCDLQYQDKSCSYSWDWSVFSELPYLPRVTYKKIILSPAKWFFKLVDAKNVNYEESLQNFIKKYKLPKLVLLIEGDNNLLINTENRNSLDIVLKNIKKYKSVLLQEYLNPSKNCFIENSNNEKFVHEIIIPLYSNDKKLNNDSYIKQNDFSNIQRNFTLGSEWVYLKLYGGNKTLDKFIIHELPRIIEYLEKTGLIDKHFFIRYEDPDLHIRIRFHLVDLDNLKNVIEYLNNELSQFIETKSIYKVQYDTYERELERYLGSAIIQSEDIFSIDSKYCQQLLSYIQDQDLRWLTAMKSVADYFEYFNYSIEEKNFTANLLAENYYSEFGNPDIVRKNLNSLYRKYSSKIEQFFIKIDKSSEYSIINTLFNNRKEEMLPIINHLRNNHLRDNYNLRNNPLLPSYIHMSMNRHFSSYQRKYEMIVLHFFSKYSNSIFQRSKNNTHSN